MNKIIVTAAILTAPLMAGAAFAHHSFAMFDNNKTITLNGVVEEFQWTNPHSHLVVKVRDAKGGAQAWMVETSSPAQLTRRGWKRSSVKANDKIQVEIHPLRSGEPGGALVNAIVNGKQIGTPQTLGQN